MDMGRFKGKSWEWLKITIEAFIKIKKLLSFMLKDWFPRQPKGLAQHSTQNRQHETDRQYGSRS